MTDFWKVYVNDSGQLGVDFDDSHSVGWDMEGLCPDCERYMYYIAAIPEMRTALCAVVFDTKMKKERWGLWMKCKEALEKSKI